MITRDTDTAMVTALGRWIPSKLNKAKGWTGKYRSVITYYSDTELRSMTFYGRQKDGKYYAWRSLEAMHSYIDKTIENTKGNEKLVADRKQKAMRPIQLKAGDILGSSWGYEQTNWDFYEVTKVVGKRTVEIRELAQERKETAWLQGDCRPKPGHYISDPITKRVNTSWTEDYISLSSYSSAHKVDPQEYQHYTAYY